MTTSAKKTAARSRDARIKRAEATVLAKARAYVAELAAHDEVLSGDLLLPGYARQLALSTKAVEDAKEAIAVAARALGLVEQTK